MIQVMLTNEERENFKNFCYKNKVTMNSLSRYLVLNAESFDLDFEDINFDNPSKRKNKNSDYYAVFFAVSMGDPLNLDYGKGCIKMYFSEEPASKSVIENSELFLFLAERFPYAKFRVLDFQKYRLNKHTIEMITWKKKTEDQTEDFSDEFYSVYKTNESMGFNFKNLDKKKVETVPEGYLF